jgi:hypothetical protein
MLHVQGGVWLEKSKICKTYFKITLVCMHAAQNPSKVFETEILPEI